MKSGKKDDPQPTDVPPECPSKTLGESPRIANPRESQVESYNQWQERLRPAIWTCHDNQDPMEPKLKTRIWVQALIRRAEVSGASAFVARKGEADAGAVVVKVSLLNGTATVWASSYGREGERRWIRGTGDAPVPDADAEAYIQRAVARDSDLWVLEVEDREGRDFLTEARDA